MKLLNTEIKNCELCNGTGIFKEDICPICRGAKKLKIHSYATKKYYFTSSTPYPTIPKRIKYFN